MRFSLLITAIFAAASQDSESFTLVFPPGTMTNVTTGDPFRLFMGIIAPKHLQNPHKTILGREYYKMDAFDITLTLESVSESNHSIHRHIFKFEGIWPLRMYNFDPQVDIVLPTHLPSGSYHLKAKFNNRKRKRRTYPISYSPAFKIYQGTNTKYDKLFQKLKGSEKSDSGISIFEQKYYNGTVKVKYQMVDDHGKITVNDVNAGPILNFQ